MSQDFREISRAVEATGLVLRGAFHARGDDGVPRLQDGSSCGTLVLLGNAGDSMWQHFEHERDRLPAHDALDVWSARVLGELAQTLGATPLLPFGGPPWHPFLRWAQRAESVFASPIGPFIHPRFGLWHAYRGALAFAAKIALPAREPALSPCLSCVDQPCLSTCPVDAFGDAGYDVPACVAHMSTAAGRDCVSLGCRARRACPVGTAHTYSPEQASFHMRAFIASRKAT